MVVGMVCCGHRPCNLPQTQGVSIHGARVFGPLRGGMPIGNCVPAVVAEIEPRQVFGLVDRFLGRGLLVGLLDLFFDLPGHRRQHLSW